MLLNKLTTVIRWLFSLQIRKVFRVRRGSEGV